jgi:hypothetical protein
VRVRGVYDFGSRCNVSFAFYDGKQELGHWLDGDWWVDLACQAHAKQVKEGTTNMDRCYKCMPHWSCDQENKRCEPKQTSADRIRAMTDDELNDLFREIYNAGIEDAVAYEWGQRTNRFEWTMEWLQQPCEED